MINKQLLKNGDLILFHTKGFSPISWGIRLLTESFWNHVGMYVDGFVIEALGNGVVKTPIEKYIDNKNYILKVMALKQSAFKDQEEYEKGLATAIERMKATVGKKYDWRAIVYLGFAYILKATYKEGRKYIPIGNPLQARNEFFCSELICEACHKISSLFEYLFQGKTKQKCDTTTPKDISKPPTTEFKGGYNVD